MDNFSDHPTKLKLYCRLRAPIPSELSSTESNPSQNSNKDRSPTIQNASSPSFSFICSKEPHSSQLVYLEDPIKGITVNDLALSERDFTTVLANYQHRVFQFNQVFSPFASNTDIYNATCKDAINGIIEGINTTILVLGPQSVGKQYLLRGEEMREKGLIMLCLDDILKNIEGIGAFTEQELRLEVSIFGIYKGKPFDLLSSRLGDDYQSHKREETGESARQECWGYTKEKIMIASTFKHLSRKSLNNLKIYCNLFNNQADTAIKDNMHLVFRVALTKYDSSNRPESTGVIDFVKVSPVVDIREQGDIEQLMRNLESVAGNEQEPQSFRQNELLSDIVLYQKSSVVLVSVISPMEKSAGAALGVLELCANLGVGGENIERNEEITRQSPSPRVVPKKKEVVFAVEEQQRDRDDERLPNRSYVQGNMDAQRDSSPEIQKRKKQANRSSSRSYDKGAGSNRESPNLPKKRSRSGSLKERTVQKSPVRREDDGSKFVYDVDENNYLLLSDYLVKLNKEIHYCLDQILEKAENREIEIEEEVEFNLRTLKQRLKKRDELQNKIDLYTKERELGIMAEIQENRNKVCRLEESLKQNNYVSVPSEPRGRRNTETQVKGLKVSTGKVKAEARSSSANMRLLEKSGSLTQTKKKVVEPSLSPELRKKNEEVKEYQNEIEKQNNMIWILRNNHRMQTDILNNLKNKFQEIEMENSKLYHNNRNLEKMLETQRAMSQNQEETIQDLEKRVVSLQDSVKSYSLETVRLKQALKTQPVVTPKPNYVQAERPKEKKPVKETRINTESDQILSIRKSNISPKKNKTAKVAGFEKETMEIQRLKQELNKAFEDLDTEKQKLNEASEERMYKAKHEKEDLLNKVEKNLDIIRENQERQLQEAEDRLREFKDYIDTLKGENRSLLETQGLLAKRLKESERASEEYEEMVKEVQKENKALRIKMKKMNEKVAYLIQENHLASQGSSELASSGLTSNFSTGIPKKLEGSR